MSRAQKLITENIATWTGAIQAKSTAGRGSSNKYELYGIKKLRELILELAVRGKLVPQDSSNIPASVLLERIAAEKAELIKAKKIKKPKALPPVSEDERPFELPEGWEWVRLGYLFNTILSGGTPSKREPLYWGGDIPWASVKDLGKDKYISETVDHITSKGLAAGSKLADKGDILICTRMGIGKIAIANSPIAFNQDIKSVKLTSHVDVDYFFNTYSTLKIKGTGTTVEGIKQEQLLNHVIGFPPISEQKLIVQKVDELMVLCDQLEQQTESSIEAHTTLVNTLLSTLTNSADADELQQNWGRIAKHFDTLFTTEQSIEALKQTILQLAVMGKLVRQNPNDEPASVLLKRIAAEKDRLVKEKQIKKQKPLPEITEDEKPFELPEGWEWVRWNNVTIKIGDIDHKMPPEEDDGIPYVSPRDFYPNNIIDFDNAKKISHDNFKRLAEKIQPKRGDIIFPRYGTIGANILVETDIEFLASYSCCVIKTFYGFMSERYQFIYSISSFIKEQCKKAENKTTQANVGIKSIQEFVMPLPPLAEQHRIVAKVDELMTLCEQLKDKLRQSQQTQVHLTDAIVEQALA